MYAISKTITIIVLDSPGFIRIYCSESDAKSIYPRSQLDAVTFLPHKSISAAAKVQKFGSIWRGLKLRGVTVMQTGRVKWFNNAKGYGFILPDEGGEDFFAHYSSIQMEGYKTLKAGQLVEFEILEGPKGSHAINIKPHLEDPSEEPTEDQQPDES